MLWLCRFLSVMYMTTHERIALFKQLETCKLRIHFLLLASQQLWQSESIGAGVEKSRRKVKAENSYAK
jgi:hypothetical protein